MTGWSRESRRKLVVLGIMWLACIVAVGLVVAGAIWVGLLVAVRP